MSSTAVFRFLRPSPLALTASRSLCHRRLPAYNSSLRRLYSSVTHDAEIHAPKFDLTSTTSMDPFAHAAPPTVSFTDLGIREPIAEALRTAFPNIQTPTDVQTAFIPAILGGKDVLLKDATGTGKSFGVMLAALNKPRIQKPDRARVDAGAKPPINTLVIVPHRDLAYQLHHWVQKIAAQMPKSLTSISSLAQVCVRGADRPLDAQIANLKEDPPHILIGTPTAIQDVLKADASALQLPYISTIVVDEGDELIASIPNVRKTKFEQMKRKHERHPSVAGLIVDAILAAQAPKRTFAHKGKQTWQGSSADERRSTRPPLQLVLSSATLRNHLRRHLTSREGWLTRGTQGTAWINGTSGAPTTTSALSTSTDNDAGVLGGTGILHSVLVVTPDGTVSNIEGAVNPPPMAVTNEAPPDNAEASFVNDVFPPQVAPLVNHKAKKPLPCSPAVIEAVATAFALDVPRVALLVLPASASVHSAVAELRELGVNAHGLNLLTEEGEQGRKYLLRGPSDVAVANPTLLVATVPATRGIDLPELSHVFVLDVAGERLVDTYVHVAGRVGRFGRGGKVVCVVDGDAEGAKRARKFSLIFKELGVQPTRFEHFE